MKHIFPAALSAIFFCHALFAQSEPAFETATVRPSQGSVFGESIRITPGNLTIEGYNMSQCLQWAYGIQELQIEGPSWFRETRFTIVAKAADRVDEDHLRLMLRRLLTERFGMRLRREVRELPVYEFVVVKGGPRFHEAGGKDASKFLASISTGDAVFTKDRTGLIAERVTIGEIGAKLSMTLQRPVIDKTGLKDRYDVRIDTSAYLNPTSEGEQQVQDRLSLLFNALQGQLGLKLQAAKDPVEMLVVEAVNATPVEN